MNELLIEIFSEEIPARMQLGAKSQAQSLLIKFWIPFRNLSNH